MTFLLCIQISLEKWRLRNLSARKRRLRASADRAKSSFSAGVFEGNI